MPLNVLLASALCGSAAWLASAYVGGRLLNLFLLFGPHVLAVGGTALALTLYAGRLGPGPAVAAALGAAAGSELASHLARRRWLAQAAASDDPKGPDVAVAFTVLTSSALIWQGRVGLAAGAALGLAALGAS